MRLWYLVFLAVILALLGLGYWFYTESSKPLVGQKLEDLGREHVEVGTKVDYNSNPPTSGPHYTEWIKSGIYENPKDDRNLVHSLEHGYVIISYNCDSNISSFRHSRESGNLSFGSRIKYGMTIKEIYAHGIDEKEISSDEASSSGQLPDSFRSDECHKLVDQLIVVFDKKKQSTNNKLIVVPNPTIDTRIALSAWVYIDKFNDFDTDRIIKFIDTHRGLGPEQTME